MEAEEAAMVLQEVQQHNQVVLREAMVIMEEQLLLAQDLLSIQEEEAVERGLLLVIKMLAMVLEVCRV